MYQFFVVSGRAGVLCRVCFYLQFSTICRQVVCGLTLAPLLACSSKRVALANRPSTVYICPAVSQQQAPGSWPNATWQPGIGSFLCTLEMHTATLHQHVAPAWLPCSQLVFFSAVVWSLQQLLLNLTSGMHCLCLPDPQPGLQADIRSFGIPGNCLGQQYSSHRLHSAACMMICSYCWHCPARSCWSACWRTCACVLTTCSTCMRVEQRVGGTPCRVLAVLPVPESAAPRKQTSPLLLGRSACCLQRLASQMAQPLRLMVCGDLLCQCLYNGDQCMLWERHVDCVVAVYHFLQSGFYAHTCRRLVAAGCYWWSQFGSH